MAAIRVLRASAWLDITKNTKYTHFPYPPIDQVPVFAVALEAVLMQIVACRFDDRLIVAMDNQVNYSFQRQKSSFHVESKVLVNDWSSLMQDH